MGIELPGEFGVPLMQRGDAAEVRLSGGRSMRITVTDDGQQLLVLPDAEQRLTSTAVGSAGGVALTTTWWERQP